MHEAETRRSDDEDDNDNVMATGPGDDEVKNRMVRRLTLDSNLFIENMKAEPC